MNYIKLQKVLRAKHMSTEGEKVDRVFAKVNRKAREQMKPVRLRNNKCLADYQYLCE